jgi:hypothetical protein
MTAGDIYTVAGDGLDGLNGDGGPATAAWVGGPSGVAVDTSGNLLITEVQFAVVRVVAVSTGTFYGLSMTAGDIYTVAGIVTQGYTGDGGPAIAAELNRPIGIGVDAPGNIVLADSYNHVIRVIAATTGTYYGRAMTVGDIYTVAGDGTQGFAGDGGVATAAELDQPAAVTKDGNNDLVIADGTSRIRIVAARTGTFYGMSMTAGDIYTVAGSGTNGFSGDGSSATAAELSTPAGIAVDAKGNLVIADTGNSRLRVVAHSTGTFYGVPMTVGDIYTAAGNGTYGFSGDGSQATAAELGLPAAVALDAKGNLVVADVAEGRIRRVAGP